MVINHLEKLFVTNDAATILRELEVSTEKTNKIGGYSNVYKYHCVTF